MKKFYLLTMMMILGFGAKAQDQFVAEIRIFAGNFAPIGWAFCDGQLLPISQNTALFSLIGTMYGGNGISTFALPNLNGKVPIGVGNGPGLSNYDQGQEGGQENISLEESEIPAHVHAVTSGSVGVPGYSGNGNSDSPVKSYSATSVKSYSATSNGNMSSAGDTVRVEHAGSGQPHNTRQPYLVVRYIIALQGIFPPRN